MANDAQSPPEDARRLLGEAKSALVATYEQLGVAAGVSKRTVQRWMNGQSSPIFFEWHALAAAVYPRDLALAERLAKRGGATLAALGLEPKPAPEAEPAPAPKPPLEPKHVDSIVCAAAELCDLPVRAVRPLVEAAFARAVELGYGAEEVARAFAARAGRKK